MAYGGAGIGGHGGGEDEVFNCLLDIPLPKDVEDIDFSIDYYESDKDFLKIANSKFPDSSSWEKRYRELVSCNSYCILYCVYFHHHDHVNPF